MCGGVCNSFARRNYDNFKKTRIGTESAARAPRSPDRLTTLTMRQRGASAIMPTPVVASFTASDVDVLVDFLDGIQVEFGSKARRDGVVSFQASTCREAMYTGVLL